MQVSGRSLASGPESRSGLMRGGRARRNQKERIYCMQKTFVSIACLAFVWAALPSYDALAQVPGNIIDTAKPTFDCTKARSATARIICLDQAGAKADWELTAAYWARIFSL